MQICLWWIGDRLFFPSGQNRRTQNIYTQVSVRDDSTVYKRLYAGLDVTILYDLMEEILKIHDFLGHVFLT